MEQKKSKLSKLRKLRSSQQASKSEAVDAKVSTESIPSSSSAPAAIVTKINQRLKRQPLRLRASEKLRLEKLSSSSHHMSPPAPKESKLMVAARRITRSSSVISEDNSERPARRSARSSSISGPYGSGLINLNTKEFHNNDKTSSNVFTYWNDSNELVSRLRLLVSSAGHTGHNNEIISIIEELREANVIE